MASIAEVGILTVAQAGTKSNRLNKKQLRLYESITIHAPAALAEAAVVEVSRVDDSTDDADYCTLQSSGADIALSAGKAITITEVSFITLRISLSAAAAAARDFVITAKERTY